MADYSTNAIQEGDVLLFQAHDRGEIEEENGFITMTQSFETAIYLSLFGGNEDDDGSESTEKLQWWGNEGEPIKNQYRSRFQYLLKGGIALTSSSATDIVEAAVEVLERDFVTPGYATGVEITRFNLVTPKRVNIAGNLILNQENVVPFNLEAEV